MLGTNDAGWNVATETYLSNMLTIKNVADSLGAMAVIINCPIALGSAAGQALIVEYCNALKANGLTNGVSDPLSLPLSDTIHPTTEGYGALAQQWANIIRNWVGV
jgi:lysophospholipase L1-like esterase